MQFTYNTKDFSNIDRQHQPVMYQTTSQLTHSNYFYSTFLPEQRAIVWRSVNRMMEMRPAKVSNEKKEKNKEITNRNLGKINQMEQQIGGEEGIRQLKLIKLKDENNIIINQIEKATVQQFNKNWDMSKEEYIHRLCQ